MKNEFNFDPWQATSGLLHKIYNYYEVPEVDNWRLPLLTYLLT